MPCYDGTIKAHSLLPPFPVTDRGACPRAPPLQYISRITPRRLCWDGGRGFSFSGQRRQHDVVRSNPPPYPSHGFSRSCLSWQPFENCVGESFCMGFTKDKFAELPTFTMRLDGGVTLSLDPREYLDPGERDGERTFYAPRYQNA